MRVHVPYGTVIVREIYGAFFCREYVRVQVLSWAMVLMIVFGYYLLQNMHIPSLLNITI